AKLKRDRTLRARLRTDRKRRDGLLFESAQGEARLFRAPSFADKAPLYANSNLNRPLQPQGA
ncbi:MAG TPA: hypothetical protein K8U77_04550, partial [Slackia equolifaciens]|nr:hypothetical protein [Slackia equolifaciens]